MKAENACPQNSFIDEDGDGICDNQEETAKGCKGKGGSQKNNEACGNTNRGCGRRSGK